MPTLAAGEMLVIGKPGLAALEIPALAAAEAERQAQVWLR